MSPTRDRKWVYGSATCLGLTLALAVLAGGGTWQRARQIDAERVTLRDSSGRICAELVAEPNGTARIALLDGSGRDRLVLKSSPHEQASLELFDRGRLRVSISENAAGLSSIRLIDNAKCGRASLYLAPDNTSGLELVSDNRHIHVASQADGSSALVVTDAQGNVLRSFGLVPEDLDVRPTGGSCAPFGSTARSQPSSLGGSPVPSFGSGSSPGLGPVAAWPEMP